MSQDVPPDVLREVTGWIGRHARPFGPLDPEAATGPCPLGPRTRAATVVALGTAARQAHELSAAAHRIFRSLVEESGFRSLALEGDDPVRTGLAGYVDSGTGDPRALLAEARSFWRTEEILAVVRWMRSWNTRHPRDPVRFARHAEAPEGQRPEWRQGPPLAGLADIERTMAEHTVRWHELTGDKIVYWGGLAHTAIGDARSASASGPSFATVAHRNLGSYLREHFGSGYVSLGLLFDHGSLPFAVPAPPPDFAEAVLGAAGGADARFLDLHTEAPPQVRAWLDQRTRTRLIGPVYDPADDAAHHLAGAALTEWFDALVHVREVSPVRPLATPGDTP